MDEFDTLRLIDRQMMLVDADLMDWQGNLDMMKLAGEVEFDLELWSAEGYLVTPTNVDVAARKPVKVVLRDFQAKRKELVEGCITLSGRVVLIDLDEPVLELGRYGRKGYNHIPLHVFHGFKPAVPKLMGMPEKIKDPVFRGQIPDKMKEHKHAAE